MRDPKASVSYFTTRTMHKIFGILIYIMSKLKFYYIHRIEKEDKILFPTITFNFEYIYVVYIIVVAALWLMTYTLHIGLRRRFRDKAIKDNTGYFDSKQKMMHTRLLDAQVDHTLEPDYSDLLPEVDWVMIEDRLFDISGLDHPGGRFITSTLRGKEISRYMIAGEEYSQLDKPGAVRHVHSPFALNMIEER